MSLEWRIDECSVYDRRMRLRGWCVAAPTPIAAVSVVWSNQDRPVPLTSFGTSSPDVAAALGPSAAQVRFDEVVPLADGHRGGDFHLRFHLEDGTMLCSTSGQSNARLGDPSHECWYRFLNRLHALPGGAVLEIGSRARSGITRRALIAPHLEYVGADVLPGPNVDVVADAHALGAAFGARRFAAVFALSVFEHLMMPWKAVLEINQVLEVGGLVFIQTPQTWPLHDEPFDFWRYSTHSWRALFNPCTGFEILETAAGERARIVPLWDAPVLHGLGDQPAYLSSTVLARKVSDSTLDWPVPPHLVTDGTYPPHVLNRLPE